jgi:hypothetical protein
LEAVPGGTESAEKSLVSAPASSVEAAPAEPEDVNRGAAETPQESKVVAWRVARRPRPDRPKRRFRREEAPAGVARHRRDGAPGSRARHEQGDRRHGGPGRDSQTKESSPHENERVNRQDEKPRNNTHKNPTKQKTPAAVAQFEPRRASTVDPNSPFAKLLELRTVLEKQGKNR